MRLLRVHSPRAPFTCLANQSLGRSLAPMMLDYRLIGSFYYPRPAPDQSTCCCAYLLLHSQPASRPASLGGSTRPISLPTADSSLAAPHRFTQSKKDSISGQLQLQGAKSVRANGRRRRNRLVVVVAAVVAVVCNKLVAGAGQSIQLQCPPPLPLFIAKWIQHS